MQNIRKFKTRRLVQSIRTERKKLLEGPEVEQARIAKQVAKRKAAKQQVKETAAEQRKKRKRELEKYESRKEQKKLNREVREIASFIEPEQSAQESNNNETNNASINDNQVVGKEQTDEEKKQKMEEELKKLQEEEEKKKKEQLAKYLQRVSPSSVFKRVSTEQAAKKEAAKFYFSSLPVPLLVKKGANAIFPQMTPLQHQIIHTCLSGKDCDMRVTKAFGQTSERVVSYMLPILSKLIQTNHQQHMAAIVLVPTVEAAKEVFAVAAQLLKFNAISTPPFVKVFTQRFKQAKIFLRTGHCHILITVPQVLLWHLKTTKFTKGQIKHLVLDSTEAFEKVDLIKQIIPDLPSDRTTLVFANELTPNVAKIANFVCKENHVKIKQDEEKEEEVENEEKNEL